MDEAKAETTGQQAVGEDGQPVDRHVHQARDKAIVDDAIDAKIAASEARTDTKFAEMRGEMRLMNAEVMNKLDLLSDKMDRKLELLSGQVDSKIDLLSAQVDSKIDLLSAQMDRRVEVLDRKFEFLSAKVNEIGGHKAEILASIRASRALTVAVAALFLAAVIAIVTFGGSMFSRGLSVRDIVKAVVAEERQQAAPTVPPASQQ